MRRNLWRECCWLLAIVAWGAPCARAATVRQAPAPAPDPRAEPPNPGSEARSPPEAAAPRTMVDRDERRVRDYVSDHETAKDVPTKVRIVGDLATPPPAANVDLGFVPRQTYVQVRRSDKELHLPRRAALADAQTAEDLLNAPRLREVVSHKKTQEVYEEQGYEDAAYDHGGYKKAGEKHEKKYIPREEKTDIARSSDQSTEQAEIINVGPFNTTDSSHSAFQTTTDRSHLVNRRNKRPKGRLPWSRPKPLTSERFSKPAISSEAHESDRGPIDRHVAANRRRRLKPTKPTHIEATTPSDRKVMEESKFHTTKKYIAELDIKPTTYRPVPPYIKGSSLKKPIGSVAKVPFVPRIGTDGYKFENPFENFKDFSNVLTTEYPLASKTSANIRYVLEKESTSRIPQYKVHETISKESREVNKIQHSLIGKAKPADGKSLTKSKAFPYSLIDNSNKISPNQQKFSDTHVKPTNFPYKIIDSTEINKSVKLPKVRIEEKWHFKTNFSPQKATLVDFKEEKVRKNPAFALGEPDRAPWIPITPRDIYDIHGYEHHGSAPIEIKVRENDNSIETLSSRRGSPIRVVDSPKIIATSYSVQHSTHSPPVRSRPHKSSFPIFENPNRFDIHDVAESSYKLKGFAGITPPTFMSIQLAPYAHSTISRPTIASMDYVTPRMQLKTSHPYDIITAHSSDIRSAYSSHPPFKPIFDRSSAPETTPRFSDGRDVETMSSNRYSVFQRVTNTTPVESTTTSLKEMNDQFNKLFSEESDKFLFRHPHLSRETTNFLKPELEETTANTTSKRDIIVSSVKNGTITHLTKVSKRNDINPQPIIVYPQDYSSSAKYVERLTLAHFSAPENIANSRLPLNYHDRLATLSNHLTNDTLRLKRDVDYDDEETVKVVLGGTTTEISVNVQKYPFYKTVRPDGISKYSVLRYISNPMEIPKKRVGQMTFYESRNNVDCVEPSPPQSIVPQREDGQWAYNPQPKLPRITLGDKISCLKIKFFGSDPLDNPFFKEKSVGFPEIFNPQNHRARTIEEGDDNLDQGTVAGIVIESVDNQDDYELVPKRLLRNKGKKVKNQFKRAVPESTHRDFTKSLVRRWIDSLAQPKTFKLYKRSPRDKFDSSNELDPADKRISKVLFVGGFLNRENSENNNKKQQKYNQKTWPNTSRLETVSTTMQSRNTMEETDRPTTPDPRIMQTFNEELTSILENTSTDNFNSGEMAETVHNRNKLIGRPNMSILKKIRPSINEVKYISSATRAKPKANRGPSRVYVDALTSLRNQQQSVLKNKTSALDGGNYKYNYKEPTWRLKNRVPVQLTSTTVKTSTDDTEIDSLLYVINPKTGSGKWMKVLRVEELKDSSEKGTKSDSEGSSNDGTASAISPPDHYSEYETSDIQSTNSKDVSQIPCQSETGEIKKPSTADYDVYHISGLLKQVAPLKASGVEINNLQTTEGNAEDDDDDVSNSYFDLEEDDNLDTTTQFPEPHERLYYYVVDDGTNE